MAMMISWVAPVNPSHPYLENDPAPSFDRNICAFHLGFSLVLQRRFKEGCTGMREGRRDAWRGSVWPGRCILASAPATAATYPARTVPGAASPHHPVHLRPGDPGHLFPPSLLQAQQERSAQQAQSDVVTPAGPGAGLVLVQPHVALFRLKLRFDAPP